MIVKIEGLSKSQYDELRERHSGKIVGWTYKMESRKWNAWLSISYKNILRGLDIIS